MEGRKGEKGKIKRKEGVRLGVIWRGRESESRERRVNRNEEEEEEEEGEWRDSPQH